MPKIIAYTLAQKLSQATTAQMVNQIASNWTLFFTHHYSEVAKLLADLTWIGPLDGMIDTPRDRFRQFIVVLA